MIKKQIIDSKQFDVKCPYSITPKGISVHNTGNLNSTAQNERDNLNWTRDERSFHFVTDKNGTIQCVDTNRNTWANGDYSTGWKSKEYINWEICEKDFAESEKMAVKDIAQFLYNMGWGIQHIKNHSTFTPSSGCPRKTLPHWNTFLLEIEQELNRLNKSNTESKYYRVQVGAFGIKGNAEKLAKELQQKGYQTTIKYY